MATWNSFKIDDSFLSEGSGGVVHVPEGYYLGEGAEVEPSPEDRDPDKFPYLLWHLRIVQGPQGTAGKILKWGPCTMKAGAQFNNGRIINISGIKEQATKLLGLDVNSHVRFVAVAGKLGGVFKGRKVTMLVADGEPWKSPRSGDIYETSKIIEIYPADDFEKLIGSVVTPTPSAPKSPPKSGPKAKKADPEPEAEPEALSQEEELAKLDALFAEIK